MGSKVAQSPTLAPIHFKASPRPSWPNTITDLPAARNVLYLGEQSTWVRMLTVQTVGFFCSLIFTHYSRHYLGQLHNVSSLEHGGEGVRACCAWFVGMKFLKTGTGTSSQRHTENSTTGLMDSNSTLLINTRWHTQCIIKAGVMP